MGCTTILVGRAASYDGSTIIARNDDSGSGHFTPKKYVVVKPEEQPRLYKSVISHVEIELPDNPMRYTCVPNALAGEGVWAACGVNEANVAMTATETITSNPRVLGADPLVCYKPDETDGDGTSNMSEQIVGGVHQVTANEHGASEKPGGIGEEDIVTIVLPYIRSAREGVLRLGALLEQYGTYEMNGIAFQDADEIWWLETIGGHHWIAVRVPDDMYVIMPNQLGIDSFDMDDAFGSQTDYMCSSDMREFIEKNHLDPVISGQNFVINPREVFGSHDDSDHVYNTPRAWYMGRTLSSEQALWDGDRAGFTPQSDDIPWCMAPDRKITMEDIKYVLSSHYQGTPYDPYGAYGDDSMRGAFRSIGINRNDHMSAIQIRNQEPADSCAVQWIAFASNAFNVMVPFYANVDELPEYMTHTDDRVSTDSFYWTSRLIAAMADASYARSVFHIERYEERVMSKSHEILGRYDGLLGEESDAAARKRIRVQANGETADMVRTEAEATLGKVLCELSNKMKNAYSRSDA